MAAARTRSAVWYAAGWAVFALGYVGAIALVATGPARLAGVGHPRADRRRQALLLRRRHGRARSASCAASGWTDRGGWPGWRTTRSAAAQDADLPAPARLTEGIRLEHVTFRYPGSDRPALDDVDLFLPAGSVVAVVGENGAGKTTLVKLLAKLYTPTSGRILVDGVDLARIDSAQWRQRLAGAFQDFFRFEFQAGQTIGLGDLPRLDVEPALLTAAGPGRARGTSSTALPGGLRTQLGPTWHDGVDVSYGQWQKLALARGFMRDEPLVTALDEPTAALDAETEHQLFERYASRARQAQGEREPDHPGVAPVQHRPHGRPHRGARRRAGRGGRQPRRADGPRRPLRRAVPNPGKGISVSAVTAGRMICCTLMYSDVQSDHDLHERFRGSGLAA